MEQQHGPAPDAGPPGAPDAPPVEVVVARSGGFAGIRRTWRAVPAAEDAVRWRELIDRCPWDDPPPPAPPEVDRFTWHIRAHRRPGSPLCADIPDSQAVGPWRDLIEAAREWPDAGPVSG